MTRALNIVVGIATLSILVDSSGFMTFPPSRRYRGRGGRPWLRRYEWERFNRMAIEELPEPLPEWDMYCRGVPYDGLDVQRLNPGAPVGVEWDILQPEGGSCSIKLLCPSRQHRETLWSGPCGQSLGKARSNAMLPANFSCNRGECFVAWYYETASRRRFCNCFDIEVPVAASAPVGSVHTLASDLTAVDSMTESIVFTSSEIATDFATLTNTFTSLVTLAVDATGSSLVGGEVETKVLPSVCSTLVETPKLELTGIPLGSVAPDSTVCSQDTLIVTMLQPLTDTVTSYSTSTCTEYATVVNTVTESPPPITATVYMTSIETSVSTVTVNAGPESGKLDGSIAPDTGPRIHSYATTADAAPMSVGMERAPSKFY